MDVLRRSSVFAAEVLDVFDRSLTEKELVSQSKALCRDYILSRLNQNGLGWSKTELDLSPSNAALAEVSLVLLCLGKRNMSFCTVRKLYTHRTAAFTHVQIHGCDLLLNFKLYDMEVLSSYSHTRDKIPQTILSGCITVWLVWFLNN